RHRPVAETGGPLLHGSLPRDQRRPGSAQLGDRDLGRASFADGKLRPGGQPSGTRLHRPNPGVVAGGSGGGGLPGDRAAGSQRGSGGDLHRRSPGDRPLHRRGPGGRAADQGAARGGGPDSARGQLRSSLISSAASGTQSNRRGVADAVLERKGAGVAGVQEMTIGVVGGTGAQGRGLATRWAAAGLKVVIGSRNAERAQETAREIAEASGGDVTGQDNAGCAAAADIVLIALPWEAHADTLRALRSELAGKIVVDCVNPLGFDKKGPYALPVPEGSAAQQAEQLLPESRVTAAFHHVSADTLADLSVSEIDLHVLVPGDDREATDVVRELVATIPGVRGIYGGRLRNAHQVEAFTANLIAINRRYKAHAGLR